MIELHCFRLSSLWS